MPPSRRPGGLVYKAAARIGCHADTIYHRARTSPAIAEALQEERGQLVDLAEAKLFEAVREGRPWAITFLLRTLGKHRGYTERTEVKNVSEADIDAAIERELELLAIERGLIPAPDQEAPSNDPDER